MPDVYLYTGEASPSDVKLRQQPAEGVNFVDAGSGGVVLAGDGGQSFGLSSVAAGGVVLAGDQSQAFGLTAVATGGVVFAGALSGTVGFANAGSGGVTLAGSSTGEFGLGATAAGGVDLAGAAAYPLEMANAGSGGVEFGGAAGQSFTVAADPVPVPAVTTGGAGPLFRPSPLSIREPLATAAFANHGQVRIGFAGHGAQSWAVKFADVARASVPLSHAAKAIETVLFTDVVLAEIWFSASTAVSTTYSRRHILEEEFLALAA